MEDFLKDRPTLSAQDTAAAFPAGANPSVTQHSAFAQIRRETPRAANPAYTAAPNSTEAQQLTGEHGTRVQTVVERGRVTKIIVTCACGKTTEIACSY